MWLWLWHSEQGTLWLCGVWSFFQILANSVHSNDVLRYALLWAATLCFTQARWEQCTGKDNSLHLTRSHGVITLKDESSLPDIFYWSLSKMSSHIPTVSLRQEDIPEVGYPGRGFSRFPSVPLVRCQDNVSNQATTTSYYIFSNSLSTSHSGNITVFWNITPWL
jgi:hypothetical protein